MAEFAFSTFWSGGSRLVRRQGWLASCLLCRNSIEGGVNLSHSGLTAGLKPLPDEPQVQDEHEQDHRDGVAAARTTRAMCRACQAAGQEQQRGARQQRHGAEAGDLIAS